MLFVKTRTLFYVFMFFVIIAIPIILPPVIPVSAMYLPLFAGLLIFELAFYLTYVRIGNWSVEFTPLLSFSIFLALFRAFMCLIAGMLAALFEIRSTTGAWESFVLIWLTNPVSLLLQMLVIALATPHILMEIAPGLLGPRLTDLLRMEQVAMKSVSSSSDATTAPPTATPAGGAYLVYSFEELDAQLIKTVGLEGFIIYSSEGVVVWKNLHINIDTDRLVIEVRELLDKTGSLTGTIGLDSVLSVIFQTHNHILFNGIMDDRFGYILIFNTKLPIPEIYGRVEVITESIKLFLSSRYGE